MRKKNKELYCFKCLPPKPMRGHKALKGIVIHERIDCPPDVLYMLNDSLFSKKTKGVKLVSQKPK